jgi:hypothetical protein
VRAENYPFWKPGLGPVRTKTTRSRGNLSGQKSRISGISGPSLQRDCQGSYRSPVKRSRAQTTMASGGLSPGNTSDAFSRRPFSIQITYLHNILHFKSLMLNDFCHTRRARSMRHGDIETSKSFDLCTPYSSYADGCRVYFLQFAASPRNYWQRFSQCFFRQKFMKC